MELKYFVKILLLKSWRTREKTMFSVFLQHCGGALEFLMALNLSI